MSTTGRGRHFIAEVQVVVEGDGRIVCPHHGVDMTCRLVAEAEDGVGVSPGRRLKEPMAARRPLRSRLSGRSSTGRSASWVIRTWSTSLRPVRRMGVSNQAESTRTLMVGWTVWVTNRTENVVSACPGQCRFKRDWTLAGP